MKMSTTHCDSSLSLNWNRNYSATITTSIILAVLSPITVAGNLLVTLSIWRNDSLRSPSYFFLAVLSAENFVCGLIYQPSYAAKELMSVLEQSRLTDSSLLFYTHLVVGGIGTYTTSIIILTITVIAIERWLYMTRRRWMNSTRVWKLLVVLLILPVPITAYRTLYILREGFCHSANMLAFICLLLFCFLTTTLTYLQVFRIIRRHQLRVQMSVLNMTSRQSSTRQPFINMTKYRKSVFTILLMLALFYLCYLPLVLNIVLLLSWKMSPQLITAFRISSMLIFLSSAFNPCLYCWRIREIRNGVKQLANKMLCKD